MPHTWKGFVEIQWEDTIGRDNDARKHEGIIRKNNNSYSKDQNTEGMRAVFEVTDTWGIFCSVLQ